MHCTACTYLTCCLTGALVLCKDSSDPLDVIIGKVQPSFVVDVLKSIFMCHYFERIIGNKDSQILYSIVHPEERKVNSLMTNVCIRRCEKTKRWYICNGFGVIFTSTHSFEHQLHMQSTWTLPSRHTPFTLHFKEYTPPEANFYREVPDTINLSFIAQGGKPFNWTGAYTLSPPTEVADSDGKSKFVRQYDRKRSGTVDYCLTSHVNNKLVPFSVTMRDGRSYFQEPCHWVVCTLNGFIVAKSLDVKSSPFDVRWWNVYDGYPKTLCSTMDICASVQGPTFAHDIRFRQSQNDSLNTTFHAKSSSIHIDGTVLPVYEMVDTSKTVLMHLIFCPRLRKWLIKAIDQAMLPLQWNLLAMSNCSASYSNPTLCKEWYVLDTNGLFKRSPLMTCEMTARRMVCAPMSAIVI